MKINATQAIVGLGLLFLVYKWGASKALNKATTAAGGPGNPIQDQAEWWSYAGSWGVQ